MTESTNRSTTRLNLTRFDHRNKNITVGPTCNKQYVVHVQIVCTFVVLPCRTIDVQRSIICSALWKYGSTFVLSYKVRKYESTFESTLYESTKVLPYNVVRKYLRRYVRRYEGTRRDSPVDEPAPVSNLLHRHPYKYERSPQKSRL